MSSTGVFRARHVGNFIGPPGESLETTGGLAGENAYALTVDQWV